MEKNISGKFLRAHLPQNIYDTMLDPDKNEGVKNLCILLGLNEEQIKIFFGEAYDALMGIVDFDELQNSLKTKLNLTDNLISFAMSKLNEILFNDLLESIKEMREVVKRGETTEESIENNPEQNISDNIQTTPLEQKNTEQILEVIKNLSQKPITNQSAAISEPIIIKEANPMTRPAQPTIEEKNIIAPEIKKTPVDDKPNKLLEAMRGIQHPKSKIDDLVKSYNTRTYSNPAEVKETAEKDSTFASPFTMKKSSSFIQKGGGDFISEQSDPNIKKQDIPDILKMKEVRESIEQDPRNIRLEGEEKQNTEPVKYYAVEENKFTPYQYEKPKTGKDEEGKFVDLSEV